MTLPISIDRHEVVIVGSGIAGTTVAHRLVNWGHRVTMFEIGPAYEYPHLPQFEAEILHQYRDPKYVLPPDLQRLDVSGNYRSSAELVTEQIMVVGGMATRWSAWTPRFLPNDFRTHTLYGYGNDWPLSYAELEPYYCAAEAYLAVSGSDEGNPHPPARSQPLPLPPFEFSYGDRVLADRLRTHGIALHTAPQARTKIAHGGRQACVNFGVCGVCPIGARYSPNFHLQEAIATGRLTLKTNAAVRRLIVGKNGSVSGVQYYDENARAKEYGAECVIVAAGAIETARLLLLSAHDNAAQVNQSGQVGRNLMFNHIWSTRAKYAEPLYMGRNGPASAQTHQFIEPTTRRAHGGVKVDVSRGASFDTGRDYDGRGSNAHWPAGPAPVRVDWRTPEEVIEEHRAVAYGALFGVHTETVPSEGKQVTLSPLLDRFGDPFAKVHHESNDFDDRAHGFAKQVAEDIATKSGAVAFNSNPVWLSGHHHIGTCRMGIDPRRSVVDAFGKAHGIDNLYVVGASTFPSTSAMNPTLTLVALALRTAERMRATLFAP